MLYTTGMLVTLCRQVGVPAAQIPTAVAIAEAESGGVTDNIGDVGLEDATWGPSLGLWQIRSVKAESGRGTARDATRLTDPLYNARSMMQISGGGTNWQPWSTYTSGAYRAHLAAAQHAAGQPGHGLSASELAGSVLNGGIGNLYDAATGKAPSLNPINAVKDSASGIVAVGKVFAALGDSATWLRILEVLLGAMCLAYGANILTKGAVGNYVHTATTVAGTAALA